MLASELIVQLQHEIEDHGDLEVWVRGESNGLPATKRVWAVCYETATDYEWPDATDAERIVLNPTFMPPSGIIDRHGMYGPPERAGKE